MVKWVVKRMKERLGGQTVAGVCMILVLTTCNQLSLSSLTAAEPTPNGDTENIGLNSLKCSDLKMGQYRCLEPKIDNETQQPVGCRQDTQTVQVDCLPVKGIYCDGQNHTGETVGFKKTAPCKWTNGHKFSVAVLLSVFLGMFGVDRFYLGYPAIGLLKLCTLGFMFLGQLVDVLLIALQVVGPSDGSNYVIDYYGPGLIQISRDNYTYVKPQYDVEYNPNYEL